MSPTTSITAKQTAGEVGRMVAIEAGAIQGDVYVEKISQVQIVMLTAAGRAQSPSTLIGIDTRPYVGLLPYRATEEALFRGREKETRQIIEALYTQNALVVYGHVGVGKTSLLAAGVSPELARLGALPIQIQDYDQPEKTILDALKRYAPELSGELTEDVSFARLIAALISKLKGTLVLILDQFELLFEPAISNDVRQRFITGLAELIHTQDRLLRVIIGIRSDALEKIGEMEAQIPSLLQRPFPLSPLTREQALQAITEPLYEIKPETKTVFDGNLVEQQLVPDLDNLTENDPGFIHPQHLQIVCDTLYAEAETRGVVRVITSKQYTEQLKGADGILASFMRRMMLTRIKEDQIDAALRILAVMASPGAARWMRPGDFSFRDADVGTIEDILKRLFDAKIVIERSDRGKAYSLVNQMIGRDLRQLAGTGKEVEEKYNAQYELERVWYTWLDLELFASAEQLRYLARAGGHLEPRSVKTLLMLRSAVEADTETSVWLERLRGDKPGQQPQLGEGRKLISELELNSAPDTSDGIGRTTVANARRLLELGDAQPSEAAFLNAPSVKFGALAQKAVSSDSTSVRHTNALALATLGPQEALNRLEAALQMISGVRRRRLLRSELRGVLADADDEVLALNRKLPVLQRCSIWKWRARRQISRNRRQLVRLTFGGAVGAGVGLGLLRAWIAFPTQWLPDPRQKEVWSQEFWIWLFLGSVLAAPLCGAIAIAKVIFFTNEPTPANNDPKNGNRASFLLLSVMLGTIGFGFAHTVLYWLNSEDYVVFTIGAPYIIPMGFAAGLGLSLALCFSISSKKIPKWIEFAIRVSIASLSFVLIDRFFVTVRQLTGNAVLHTQITRSQDFFRALLRIEDPPHLLGLFTFASHDAQILAIVYAALTGALVLIGVLLGLWRGGKLLERNGLR